MKVLAADFVTSASPRLASSEEDAGLARGTPKNGLPGIPRDGLSQVALAGRSNVGKSSLINALARRKIARTSAAPGKTRLVNVYRIDVEGGAGLGRIALYLVDLPGYGYARGGAGAAAELKAAAEAYFASYEGAPWEGPRGALLVVDSRHPGLDADIQAARWLASIGVEIRIVATKIDKLTRSERARNLKAIGDTFGTAAQPVSSASGEGLDALWRTIVTIARDADRDG